MRDKFENEQLDYYEPERLDRPRRYIRNSLAPMAGRFLEDETRDHEAISGRTRYSAHYRPSSGRKYYSGYGPKNYHRTDERLCEIICELLFESQDIDAREIEVEARDGVITLRGTVPERWMRYEAEDLTVSIIGVSDIRNELEVQKSWQKEETSEHDQKAS